MKVLLWILLLISIVTFGFEFKYYQKKEITSSAKVLKKNDNASIGYAMLHNLHEGKKIVRESSTKGKLVLCFRM